MSEGVCVEVRYGRAVAGLEIFDGARQNQRSGGQKSPSGVQGRSPGGDLGAKPQKLTTF